MHHQLQISEQRWWLQGIGLESKLLDGVLPCRELSGKNAQNADHRHSAVADLLGAHLISVHLQAKWVTKVAWFLGWILAPLQLQDTTGRKDEDQPQDSLARSGSSEGALGALEAREPQKVLPNGPNGGHHGDTAMLNLRGTQLLEAGLVADLAEAERVKVAERHSCANLLCGVERRGRRRALRRLNGGDRGQGPAPLNSGGCRGGSRKTPCVAPR
mmetsp:Transcript_57142/g.170005  ORF Transcript_57142/g.170005 Transcript_57142/m.170005 type:complete len:215 (-) Transcript_57142:895-1539(-)